MERATIRFRVPVTTWEKGEGDALREVQKWLTPDGGLDPSPERGVEFCLWRSARVIDRARIEKARHELAGGIGEWVDLSIGIENVRQVIVTELERVLWPDGRPEATGEEASKQQDALTAAWMTYEGRNRAAWLEMVMLRDRLQFMAMWDALLVSPVEWNRIEDREITDDQFMAIWNAWMNAQQESTAEKRLPSEP